MMNTYCLLLRGINLGKNNKVSMPLLKEQLESIGLSTVNSYINTGNLFFSSEEARSEIEEKIANLLSEQYEFPIPFVVIHAEKVLNEELPTWWAEPARRKDALFYLSETEKEMVEKIIADWSLAEEDFLIGETVLFWRVREEANYKQTAYSKKIMAKPFNQMVTLRNANTFDKLRELILERVDFYETT